MRPQKLPPLVRSILIALAIALAVIIYAYGVEVTQVNLSETQKPERLTQLTRIIRAIAQPEVIEYEQAEVSVRTPFYLPCPEGNLNLPEPNTSGPYIVVTPPCADEGEEVTIEGFNFEPNTSGPINFIPPSAVRLQRGNVTTDSNGHFLVTVKLPNRATDEVQNFEVTLRTRVGGPRFTRTAIESWHKIVETVFLALLATTIGIAIAIPASFFAASNLMRPITSPLVSLGLTLLALPVGLYLGAVAVRELANVGVMLGAQPIMGLGALVISPLVVWGAARWALPQEETVVPPRPVRLARTAVLVIAAVVVFIAMGLLSVLLQSLGNLLQPRLGDLGFLGYFTFVTGQALQLLMPVIGGLAGAFVLTSLAGSTGDLIHQRVGRGLQKALAVPLTGAAVAVYFGLIGAAIGWLYQLEDPTTYLWIPAAIGAALGLAWAAVVDPERPVAIGSFVYYVTRTVLNALRSVEPLIMVIVFAVWVGIGPFAGTLALALHTIAALGKLYSEQVESILAGPLEAIQATGATRLQTIVYAVIPQVIPPFISFTMYRWDINVRMSTIIGFAGGGGIGFLLSQNINLLQYRAAAVQMLAIAIVVASMDYLSAKLREKVI